jgi:hypothetical protein
MTTSFSIDFDVGNRSIQAVNSTLRLRFREAQMVGNAIEKSVHHIVFSTFRSLTARRKTPAGHAEPVDVSIRTPSSSAGAQRLVVQGQSANIGQYPIMETIC